MTDWPGLSLPATLLLTLASCLPAQEVGEGLETMRIVSTMVDPADPEITVVHYQPTHLISTTVNGDKPAPLTRIRWSDEKVLIQGWVALHDASEAEKALVEERIEGDVRFEIEPPETYDIALKHDDTELEHLAMEGRYGEKPATLNVELIVPTDETKESIDVVLTATVVVTGSTSERITTTTPQVTTTRTTLTGKTWEPIEVPLPVSVPANLQKAPE